MPVITGRAASRPLTTPRTRARGAIPRRLGAGVSATRPPCEARPRPAPPVLLALITDPTRARRVHDDLERRFGRDYRVLVATTVSLARAMLDRFQDERVEVAIVLADYRLDGETGTAFLASVRACHPGAKRALLSTLGDHPAATPIHQAMALGQLDLIITWPWVSPEESLYPSVSEALAGWWRANRPMHERVRVVGRQWDPRSHLLRDLGKRNGVPFGFYDAATASGTRLLREMGADARLLPVVSVDGEVLANPSLTDIADRLGATTTVPRETSDVAIIGAGPAGLGAAVYAASEGLRTVVFEPTALGGQAGMSAMIRNYLGFPLGISGDNLTRRAHEQALHFGATVVHSHAAVGLRAEGDLRVVTMSNGDEARARTVVLATGVAYRQLEAPELQRLIGAGVFYGAATTEARALAGEVVHVAGAGNSAGQAALHLAEFAERVTLIVRGDSLDGMSAYLSEQIRTVPNIDVRYGTRVVGGAGDARLERLLLEDAAGKRSDVPSRALFVLIGARPRTEWLEGALERDAGGYIVTCRDLGAQADKLESTWQLDRIPLPMETSMPGVFAVGDVRHGSVKRVASAVGEGATAVASIHQFVTSQLALA